MITILASIHGMHVDRIFRKKGIAADGTPVYVKNEEVRKVIPKGIAPDESFRVVVYKTKDGCGIYKNCGLVVGEFICDRNIEYVSEFYNDDTVEQTICEIERDEDYPDEDYGKILIEGNELEEHNKSDLCRNSCLTRDEIWNYVGVGLKRFYGWHIGERMLYDKPRQISDFYFNKKDKNCATCGRFGDLDMCGECTDGEKHITILQAAPQSWCYISGCRPPLLHWYANGDSPTR